MKSVYSIICKSRHDVWRDIGYHQDTRMSGVILWIGNSLSDVIVVRMRSPIRNHIREQIS